MEDYDKPNFPSQKNYDNDLEKDPDNFRQDDNTKCSDEKYQKIFKVREIMQCKKYRDEYDAYLMLDVTLLADVFEFFRNRCYKTYKVDSAWCISIPGYSWACMMKQLKHKVKLITDIDIHMFFERGSRGGICIANHRLLVEKENTHILHIDANNLYGDAMQQYLPDGNFCNLEDKKKSDFTLGKIFSLEPDSLKGYAFEINLSIGSEYHKFVSDLPPAPKNRHFDDSEFMAKLREKCNITDTKECKLTPNLKDKKKYIIHYKTLQFYLKLGIKIEKIHRIIEFTQLPWLKEYVDLNTKLRKKVTNKIDKDIFKLMNCSVFSRLLMNL